MHRPVHVGDAILGEQHDLDVAVLVKADEVAHHRVDLIQIRADFFPVDAHALQVVVEVRQINQREAGPVLVLHPLGGLGDPDA